MAFANFGAAIRGFLPQQKVDEINAVIHPLVKQAQRERDYSPDPLLANIKKDKKRVGSGLPLVCPTQSGLVLLKDISEDEFAFALDKTMRFLGVNRSPTHWLLSKQEKRCASCA